jgi:hypothetical protein
MKIFIPLTAILLTSTMAFSAEMQIAIIQKKYSAEIPGDVPFGVKPMGSDTGVGLVALVTGEELTNIVSNSLVADEIIDAKGINIGKNRNGESICEMGFSPEVSPDGKYISFDFKIQKFLYGNIGKNQFKGKVKVLHGGKLITEEVKINPKSDKPYVVGGYAFVYSRDMESDGTLVVSKSDDLLSQVKIFDGENEIDGGGTITMNNVVSYGFNKVPVGDVTLKIKYWKGTEITELPLNFSF